MQVDQVSGIRILAAWLAAMVCLGLLNTVYMTGLGSWVGYGLLLCRTVQRYITVHSSLHHVSAAAPQHVACIISTCVHY